MPKRLRIFLKKSYGFHLTISVLIAIVLRLLVSVFNYGPQSLDDYKHCLIPALQISEGITLNIPEYRNMPLVWMTSTILNLLKTVGIHDRLLQVNILIFLISSFSLFIFAGIYFYEKAKKTFSARSICLLYFMALNPILAFVSTRLLGESACIGFLTFSFGLFYSFMKTNKNGHLVASLLLCGVATVFRFQIGIIYIYFSIILLLFRSRYLYVPVLVGIFLIAVQGLIDFISGKVFLGTLLAYFKINSHGAVEFGTSPWYSTWLTLLGFFLFPLSLAFARTFKKVFTENKFLMGGILLFTFSHSLIPHKEERFLFPILPLTMMLLFYMWFSARKLKFTKYFLQPLMLLLFSLIFRYGIMSNSQQSVVGPVAELKETALKEQYIFDIKPLFGNYGLREFFISKRRHYIEIETIEELKKWLSEKNKNELARAEIIVLTSSENYPTDIKNHFITGNLSCNDFKMYQSSSDRILYALNKQANYRRMASWMSYCNIH